MDEQLLIMMKNKKTAGVTAKLKHYITFIDKIKHCTYASTYNNFISKLQIQIGIQLKCLHKSFS